MMDAIERAKHLIKAANEADEPSDYIATVTEAHAMAAIAQAEQLKRIADALYVRISGVDIQLADVLYAISEPIGERSR